MEAMAESNADAGVIGVADILNILDFVNSYNA
jgi:hypothetical protein